MSSTIKKKVKIVLTISLLLNVLLLSMLGGQAYRSEKREGRWHEWRESLAPETRDAMKSAFKGKKDDIKAIMDETREKMTALEEVIGAEEFDVDAYNRAAFSVQELGARVSMHRLSTFRDLLADLPQEERQKIAKMVAAKIMSKHHRKGGWKKGRDHTREASKNTVKY